MPFESTLGLCRRHDARSLAAGAGATATTLVVAGGHDTGWIAPRLVVRSLCEPTCQPGETPRFIGAADHPLDDSAWSSRERDRRVAYAACEQLINSRAASTIDAAMLDLDRAFHRIRELPHRIDTPLVSCTVVRIDGDQLHGAHAGISRALLLRRDSPLGPLTEEHYLDIIAHRGPVPGLENIKDPRDIPKNIIVGGLGLIDIPRPMAGLDTIDKIHLAPGDVLLLCSERLPLTDDELTPLLRRAHREPLDEVLQTIITACLATAESRIEISLALLRRI